jgi:hypothetical protein
MMNISSWWLLFQTGAKLQTSSFLLELLHTQQKNYVFLNFCNSIHTIKPKYFLKITFDYTFSSTLLWPHEPLRFLGNSDSADRLFRGNFRPFRHNIFTQNLDLSMYCYVISRNITKKYQFYSFSKNAGYRWWIEMLDASIVCNPLFWKLTGWVGIATVRLFLIGRLIWDDHVIFLAFLHYLI